MVFRKKLMRERTTKKQRELLNYLDAFIKANHFSPSYREIAQVLGYKSVSTVAVHINNLVALGYIKKNNDVARSLEVIPAPSELSTHEAWLRRRILQKQKSLREQGTLQARRDIAALDRAGQLLGIEEV